MYLRYFLNDFETVSVAPIIIGIAFVFTPHTRCISILRSFHFRAFLQHLLTCMLLFHYHGLYC